MSTLALTQIYLEQAQKKALAACAKKSNRKVSEVVREAVDTYLMGVTLDDLKLLDAATAQAQQDIAAMNATLDGGLARADRFFAEIERIKEAA